MKIPSESNVTYSDIIELIKSADEVAICGHINPDGDALGSNLAVAALCRALGTKAISLLAQDNPAPELYDFLPGYEFTPAAEYTGIPDLFISVDSPNSKRIVHGVDVCKRAKNSLVLDHHPNYEPFGANYYGDTAAAATGTIVWRLIQASGITPTKEMAMYCYVAVMTDTGRFSFGNTNYQTFIDAAQMIQAGADPAYLSRMVYENKSLESMQLESRLIDRIKFLAEGGLVYSYIYEQDMQELSIHRDATEGLPAILRSIKGVQVAALFREEDSGVRVNLRSRSGFDVGKLATGFGGGGHAAAAGISLDMSLAEALEFLVPKLKALF
jgi:phosphoesterase RecJ-like protein